MRSSFEFEAENRSSVGTASARTLRRANQIPAVIYGGGKPPVLLSLDHNSVKKRLENEAVYSHVLKIRYYSCYNGRRGPPQRIDNDQQLHKIFVGGSTCRLNDKNFSSTNIFFNLDMCSHQRKNPGFGLRANPQSTRGSPLNTKSSRPQASH